MRLHGSKKKDPPPDYSTVINMKIIEDEDLPTYLEAVAMEGVNKVDIGDLNVEQKVEIKV